MAHWPSSSQEWLPQLLKVTGTDGNCTASSTNPPAGWPKGRQLFSYLFPSYSWEQLATRSVPRSSPRMGNQPTVSWHLLIWWDHGCLPVFALPTIRLCIAIDRSLMYISDKPEIHWKGQSRTSMEEEGKKDVDEVEVPEKSMRMTRYPGHMSHKERQNQWDLLSIKWLKEGTIDVTESWAGSYKIK